MKSRFLKLLALIVISVFIFSAIIGCGSAGNNTDQTQVQLSTDTKATDKTVETAAADVQKKPVKIMMNRTKESNQADMDRVQKYIEDKSGIKFEFKVVKTQDDYDNQINLSLAANEDIDVIQLNSDIYKSLLERGCVKVINETLQKYGQNILKNLPEDAWKAVSDLDGNIYGIPYVAQQTGSLTSVRKDWREKLNLDPISSIDEFEAYLKAVRDGDFDGNGKKDTLPLASYNNSDGTYGDFEVSFLQVFTDTYSEIGYNYIDSNNNVVPIVMHPKYKDYLATLAKWKNEGLLSSDIIQNDQLNDMITNNQVGAVGEWYSMHFNPLVKLKEKVPEADYEVILPKSLSGNAYKLPISGIYGPETLFISYSQNTEFAMKLFDWFMQSPDNYWTQKAGVEGEDWEWVDKNAQTYKTLKQLEKPEQGYNLAFSISFYPPWNLFLANADAVNQMYYERQAFYLKYGSYYEPSGLVCFIQFQRNSSGRL